jgi:hypothetical protein
MKKRQLLAGENLIVLCFLALTLDGSRTLNSQIASGRCSVLCPEDVETASPEYTERNPIPDNLSWGMKKRQLLAGENL